MATSGQDDAPVLPYTGKEFLDSLDDGREVWIYGERVGNITEHPAFRNTARMIARLYDALHRLTMGSTSDSSLARESFIARCLGALSTAVR